MAQKLCVYKVCLVFLFSSVCVATIENIDLNYTQPAATFDELYSDAIELYTNESWTEAIRSFHLALADYRHESQVRANCLVKCREKVDKSSVLKNSQYDGGSLVLYYVIRERRCCDLCQETFMGRRTPIARYVRNSFEKREPYNYLQFSYFKAKQYQKAADAAFTYLERNPDDDVMQTNLNLYTGKFSGSADLVKSMENQHHAELYLQGDREYTQSKYSDCVHTFEAALEEYYKEHKKCQALCEYQHQKHQASFSVALFSHHTAIVECRLACAKNLATFHGSQRDKFLENHYHYLQFCYFEIGRVKDAAICAKTHLLFQPDDPIMKANMEYYSSNIHLKSADIAPRMRAVKHIKQRDLDKKLLQIARHYADPDMLFDNGAVPDLDDLEEDDSEVRSTSSANDMRSSKSGQGGITGMETEISASDSWKKNPFFRNITVFQEGKDLNGTERFVVDNMAMEEECKLLSALVDKLSKFGDGYKHNHPDPKHPFTDKETFEGVSIRDAVLAAANGEITIDEAELYANISDKMRQFTAEYFNLKKPLYIAFTHLVCRTASDDAKADDHLSHPVHSDNCILGADGPGTCPKIHPAYTWRDFSGVMYLNDDFEGGEFIFADPDMKIQAAVTPKCGRMVSFSGGIKNLHGVLGVKSGRRCALPLWFTYQKDKIEDNRGKYMEILGNLRSQKFLEKQPDLETLKTGSFDGLDDDDNLALRPHLRSEL